MLDGLALSVIEEGRLVLELEVLAYVLPEIVKDVGRVVDNNLAEHGVVHDELDVGDAQLADLLLLEHLAWVGSLAGVSKEVIFSVDAILLAVDDLLEVVCIAN